MGSDVNLAVGLLNDAWLSRYECAVVVSNDGDLAGAMRLVKKQGKKLVVLAPGDPATRPHSVQLTKWSHKITSIPLAAIAGSQLPNPIPGTKIHKPKAW
jgi:NYN domain